MPDELVHHYLSTACWHLLHNQCREFCKYCARLCICECHHGQGHEDARKEWEQDEEDR